VNIAVIPARGGSRRIPRKNLRTFVDRPIIAHSIGCALDSGVFDRVLVSTDNDEIAATAIRYGAEVPFVRPAELADDHASTPAVMSHAVAWLNGHAVSPDAVCCIYATAPLMRSQDLRDGLGRLESGPWAYVFSAAILAGPVLRSFRQTASGGLQMLFPEHYDARSQDLPQILQDAGQFYWGRPLAWLRQERIFEAHSTVVVVPPSHVRDIDTLDDWHVAERLWVELYGTAQA